MARLAALKINVSALTASFRVPHVMIGRLPTFKLPPPATIYGYLSGAVGTWFDPSGISFAYVFTYEGIAEDLELAHIVEKSSGTLWKGGPPKNLQGNANPQRREFLLHPKLTLYLTGPTPSLQQMATAVKRPRFAALLGRSQDLATCNETSLIELEKGDEGFFSDTILPWNLRPWVLRGTPVMMPKSIDYSYLREPRFERYLEIGHFPLRVCDGSPDLINFPAFGHFYQDRSESRTSGGKTLYRGLIFEELGGATK